MTIYFDDGKTVKIYPVKNKVAKAVMTLLELDDEMVWSETHTGYGVEIVDKVESEDGSQQKDEDIAKAFQFGLAFEELEREIDRKKREREKEE